MFRNDYSQAASFLVETVQRIPDNAWKQPALGAWNVRDLVGHATRALLTVETYCETQAEAQIVADPTDYFMRALGMLANHGATDDRARETGLSLGNQPKAAVGEIADRVLKRLESIPDDFILSPPTGGTRLSDYLPTRTLEMTVHTLDIAKAVGLEVQPPEGPLSSTLTLLADLALRQGEGQHLALALTGRGPLLVGFSVMK
ncbi:MAG: Mycothiol maleylpyruvate isomerase N-terminal domain-containing protein [Chloroflexi bacterium]|jgi:uncharacterized protein (TIGR03083 family)|nr:MAG: Mycothiol maleylpyruvate isomerase N-terminal domain-containing protein [Chloroflexota bacterium]